MKKKIEKAIKKYNLIEELKNHSDIIERYRCGELDFEYGDESGDEGFWDEAGFLATKGIEFGDAEKWDKAIANQDIIYYGFMQFAQKQLESNIIEKELTIKIRVDKKNISKLYRNYDINYDSVEDFMLMLIREMETPVEMNEIPFSSMREFGYEVYCITD